MPTAITVALISAIVALSGILINHRLTLWRSRRDTFIVAANSFRNAFIPAITRLEKETSRHRNILNEEFRSHEKAAVAFRNSLGTRLASFNKAWQAYEDYAKNQVNCSTLAFIITEVDDLSLANNPAHIKEVSDRRKNECLAHFNALFEFTKYKE